MALSAATANLDTEYGKGWKVTAEVTDEYDYEGSELTDLQANFMEEYGIELVTFYVNEISVPEDDTAVKKLKDALSKKAEMDIIGYYWI